jgi:hypothetical protein
LERIYTYFYDVQEDRLHLVDPKSIWDFEDPSGEVPPLPPGLAERLEAVREQADDTALEHIAEMQRAAEAERQREVKVKRRDAAEYYDFKIAQSQQKIAEYAQRAVQGEDVRLANAEEERRLQRLAQEKEEVGQALQRQMDLTADVPHLVAVAAVLPLAGSHRGDRRPVEQAGMAVAMAYERDAGRLPVDVSLEFRGYDIHSSRSGSEDVRYIEVKAFADSGMVQMTQNEWLMANKLRDRYWLYVVERATSEGPTLHTIQDPVAKFTNQSTK